MKFIVTCDHNIMCHPNCHIHCGKTLKAYTLNQAILLKHAHKTDNEIHELEIRDDEMSLVSLEKARGW